MVGLPSNSILAGNHVLESNLNQFLGPVPTTASVLSWGFGDSALYLKPGKQGEEVKVALLPANDPVVIGASHPKLSAIWLGHKSGRISVYKHVKLRGQSKYTLVLVTRLYGHMSELTSLLLSPEYSLAVSSNSEGHVMTWDLHSQACLHHTLVDCAPRSGLYTLNFFGGGGLSKI